MVDRDRKTDKTKVVTQTELKIVFEFNAALYLSYLNLSRPYLPPCPARNGAGRKLTPGRHNAINGRSQLAFGRQPAEIGNFAAVRSVIVFIISEQNIINK